uniref:Uncharacterized protein n=1 Tax=Anguilla anguilla TaxID=7936 RepID=A0A0E9QWX8_ANGAN
MWQCPAKVSNQQPSGYEFHCQHILRCISATDKTPKTVIRVEKREEC